jgi:hypothetical protein
VTVYRLVVKDTVEERILERARQKSDIQSMVMTGSTRDMLSAELKSSEVASLLLDSQIEGEIRRRRGVAPTMPGPSLGGLSANSPPQAGTPVPQAVTLVPQGGTSVPDGGVDGQVLPSATPSPSSGRMPDR